MRLRARLFTSCLHFFCFISARFLTPILASCYCPLSEPFRYPSQINVHTPRIFPLTTKFPLISKYSPKLYELWVDRIFIGNTHILTDQGDCFRQLIRRSYRRTNSTLEEEKIANMEEVINRQSWESSAFPLPKKTGNSLEQEKWRSKKTW